MTEFRSEFVEQTIQNPDGTTEVVYISGPRFSIHSFLFPFDSYSTGTLKNEVKFQSGPNTGVFKIPFSDGRKYYLAIVSDLPTNEMMLGDILVSGFDTTAMLFAYIRVFGWITSLPGQFLSENSEEYCNYIRSIDPLILDNGQSNDIRYGLNLTNSKVRQYTQNDVVVLDENNNIVQGVTPSVSDINLLLSRTVNKAIDIEVRVGDIYYYKSRLGKSYFIVITNFQKSPEDPNKRRLTIMFSPLF